MATSPKLDFFRISLVPKGKNKSKTFRDFAQEVMLKPHTSTDLDLRMAFLDRFMSKLASTVATDENSKKQVRWIDNELNLYRSFKPTLGDGDIIWGVLQGGRFGSKGLLSNAHFDEETGDDAETILPESSVLKYFYFMLFLPLDHREGCLIIHSNSRDESTSDILQRFIKYFLTDGENYKNPRITHFCPKYLQDLFKGNAFVKQINLSNSFVDTNLNDNGICEDNDEYKLQVIITPKNKKNLEAIPRLRAWLASKLYKQDQLEAIRFSDFTTQNVTIQNEDTKRSQSFRISEENINLCPVVDIKTLLDEEDFEIDGTTPKFDVLHQKVLELFINQVRPEIIPST